MAPHTSPNRQEQVGGPARALAHLLEAARDEVLIAIGLERLQPRNLLALRLGVDAKDVLDLGRVLDVLVDADDDVLPGAVALVVAERRLLDLVLDEGDGVDRSAELVDLGDELERSQLDLVGQCLDEVRAGEGIDGVGRPRLVGDDLLRAQRDLGRALAGQRQGLVEAVGVQ
jgi:hypothetical protein